METKSMPTTTLKYVDGTHKGYKRLKYGKKFRYKNLKGDFIKDIRTLRRIESLVIPPAWKKVWICPDPKGHIQCYGYDLRDRKQYIYHPDWTVQQGVKKFKSLTELGGALGTLKRRISKDLKSEGWGKEQVCALALTITQKTLMRIGNARYTKENKSYGLTTLKKTHFKFEEKRVLIQYVGKKGVEQLHEIKDAKLYKMLHSLYDVRGKNMFKYYATPEAKKPTKLKAKDVNRYLAIATGDRKITVKSFRIWGASIMAIREMVRIKGEYCDEKCQKQLNEIIDKVAKALGNTRDVAKKYYVYPMLQELFLNNKFYRKVKIAEGRSSIGANQCEQILRKLLG